jgi:plasmid stability protein
MESKELVVTTMRLPANLRKWLKIRAINNNRSFNSEAIELFEREKEREEKKCEKPNK